MWLNDDIHGADLLAISTFGDVFKIQLKGRLTFEKKYMNKNIYMSYPSDNGFYIYSHDEALELFIDRYKNTTSWNEKGWYSSTTKFKEMEQYFFNEDSESISF
jgi:hypothetical protein